MSVVFMMNMINFNNKFLFCFFMFLGDFQKRKKARERKVRNDKKQERKMQIRENKKNGKCKGIIVMS